MATLDDFVSFLQGASNSAASNLSAPVDGINWLLGKAGLPVSKAPVGGSDWLRQAGFTAEPKNRNAGLLGEFVGGVMPIVLAAKAPQIAAWLNQAGRNLSAPRTLNPQTGAIVWHGSPHKFEKFSMDKIGTGEGAQAYGHGLYLAESPAVANEYAAKLGKPELVFGGKPITQLNVSQEAKDAAKWIESRAGAMSYGAQGRTARDDFSRLPEKIRKELGNVDLFDGGNLYKTDIPDEAVARMLDWDKPLSQQAPEVQAALSSIAKGSMTGEQAWKAAIRQSGNPFSNLTAKEGAVFSTPEAASSNLNRLGINGIRYLDGGSRGAGGGTSNFVVFDPEMIRILERNGQATGAVPWQPGEWRGLLGNN